MQQLLLQRRKISYAHGRHGNSDIKSIWLFAYSMSRKMKTGAVKSGQKWGVFSSLCQMLVPVIWLSSVVNRVLRYTSRASYIFEFQHN